MGWELAVFLDVGLESLGLIWIILPAVLLGILVGAVPGFSAQNSLIILLPLTLSLPVDQALAFMVSLYAASHLGGGIPAILINMPGTGGAAATTLDGYPMTKRGDGQEALVLSFDASTVGGLITSIVTLLFLPVLSQVGLYVRSVEMVVILLFGLSLIALISAEKPLKGLIAGFFGLLIGAIGTDHIYSTPRATFGFLELYDGVPLAPALIGLFAISEAFVMLEREMIIEAGEKGRSKAFRWAGTMRGLVTSLRNWWQIVWTSMVGLVVGIVPGAGASIAPFVAYQQSRLFSKTPERYGKGHPPGVIAPEAANNGVTSGTLVPLMTIGVPGGSTAAVMMIVLQYHGVTLGPRLFTDNPTLAYGVFFFMALAYLCMLLTILPLARYISSAVLLPTRILVPLICSVTIIGAFAAREYVFDMGLALAFGVLGYIARKTEYQVTAMLIGIILGPILERYLLLSLRLGQGDILVLFSSPTANVLWILLVASFAVPGLRKLARRRRT